MLRAEDHGYWLGQLEIAEDIIARAGGCETTDEKRKQALLLMLIDQLNDISRQAPLK